MNSATRRRSAISVGTEVVGSGNYVAEPLLLVFAPSAASIAELPPRYRLRSSSRVRDHVRTDTDAGPQSYHDCRAYTAPRGPNAGRSDAPSVPLFRHPSFPFSSRDYRWRHVTWCVTSRPSNRQVSIAKLATEIDRRYIATSEPAIYRMGQKVSPAILAINVIITHCMCWKLRYFDTDIQTSQCAKY